MNALVNLNKSLTMSSRDFLHNLINPARIEAGECEVRNNDFIARIEDEIDDLGAYEILVSYGKESKVYQLTVEQMTLVGMRESKSVRRQVLAKLKSMESPKESIRIPKSFAEALRMAADQAEQIEQQQFLIEQQKPAVEFVGKYVAATSGNMTFRAVAKILKVNERELRQFLSDNKIMYKLGGDWVPHQPHIDAGRFEVKTGLAEHEESSHAFKQSKFTPKGVEWLAGEYAKNMASKAINAEVSV